MAEVPVCLCLLWDPCPWHMLHAPLTCGPSGLRAVTCYIHTMTGIWVLLLIQGSEDDQETEEPYRVSFPNDSIAGLFLALEKLILVHMSLTQSRSQVAKVS